MNFSNNWIFLWRLPIQNYSKLSITENRRNKAKYLTWNSIRFKFVKNTTISNLVECLCWIKCLSSSSPDLLKALAILSDSILQATRNMTMFLCLDITKFLESHGIKTTNVDSSLVQQHIQQHSVHRGINPTSQKHPPILSFKSNQILS